MELKDIILPVGVLVVALIILGVVTLSLTLNVNDKVNKLSDMNNSVSDLTVQVALLSADNLQVKTNYNTLLSTYNNTNTVLTNTQNELTAVTGKYQLAQSTISSLTVDNNKLTVANVQLVLDKNILNNNNNDLITINNDYNARAHRLFTALNNCYLDIKTHKDSNIIIGDANYNLMINTCVTSIDTNMNDFNYFR